MTAPVGAGEQALATARMSIRRWQGQHGALFVQPMQPTGVGSELSPSGAACSKPSPALLALARELNPQLRCAVLAHTDEEEQWLAESGVSHVLRSQRALAEALARVVGA